MHHEDVGHDLFLEYPKNLTKLFHDFIKPVFTQPKNSLWSKVKETASIFFQYCKKDPIKIETEEKYQNFNGASFVLGSKHFLPLKTNSALVNIKELPEYVRDNVKDTVLCTDVAKKDQSSKIAKKIMDIVSDIVKTPPRESM